MPSPQLPLPSPLWELPSAHLPWSLLCPGRQNSQETPLPQLCLSAQPERRDVDQVASGSSATTAACSRGCSSLPASLTFSTSLPSQEPSLCSAAHPEWSHPGLWALWPGKRKVGKWAVSTGSTKTSTSQFHQPIPSCLGPRADRCVWGGGRVS